MQSCAGCLSTSDSTTPFTLSCDSDVLCTGGSALTGAGSDAAIAAVAGATAGSIADIVAASENHETLLAAVTAAGLVDTFAGEGSFTLFAPTDAAFAALPDGTVEALLADIPALTAILTYHALGAAVVSGDLSDGLQTTTLQGTDITVTITDGGVFINGARVTIADVAATNGVVHVIDAVLLPPSCSDMCEVTVSIHVEAWGNSISWEILDRVPGWRANALASGPAKSTVHLGG